MAGDSAGMTAEALARACAESMWTEDLASQRLGMSLDAVSPGAATVSMTVTREMSNGHGTCHGGYVFTLADSAFAFACNGYNQRAVAQHCSITFVAPAHAGDRLIAVARENTRFGRSGIYDITVTRADGTLIAEFRGHSRTVRGTHLPEDAADQQEAGGEA